MEKSKIRELESAGHIVRKTVNKPLSESLIEAALESADFALANNINEKTATGVFKEMYDAFRQLGDARWWLLGFETHNHKASMEILMNAPIIGGFKLKQLDRFRKIRNDANYRGFKISPQVANEIVLLWQDQSASLLKWVRTH